MVSFGIVQAALLLPYEYDLSVLVLELFLEW